MIRRNKLVAMTMVAAMGLMSFAGCGATTTGSANNSGSAEAAAPADGVFHIGVCQLLEHQALDAATQGFVDELTEKLGKDKVVFDIQNAQGEEANCATIVSGFVSSDVDLILANATASLQAASQATADIPILGTSITDYGAALGIENWTGTSGTNISGTSDLAPISEQADMLMELVPNAKQVGLLYCSAEANSVYQIEQMEAALDKAKVAHERYSAADSNEIQSVVTKAVSECDVLYIPTDNTLASNTEIIDNIAGPAGIPIIAGEKGIVEGCGIATLSIDYYELGKATGDMAYEILVNGADISKMEVQYAPNVTKLFMADRCTKLNIKVPEGYTELKAE
ncbi:MAG: ABC transporter substrate-binding protein [Clostridia bacterium]|nr:ABC transporter substrate-binding protein [Clostridia bacterium]